MSTTATAPSLADLASSTRPDRNRAIDFYRAVAMIAVAVGHWMATAATVSRDGQLDAGNALEHASGLHWMSWIFQVMPLFFVVGGFSSAMSLDSFARGADRPQDWVVNRLRRMLSPTMVLAGVWMALLAGGALVGAWSLLATAALSAAIPLWFLANYTIDTAIAPYVLPAFRRHPVALPALGVAAFISLEIARLAGVPVLPHLNWVLGWLLFQVAGFAWRDGLLPSGAQMLKIAGGLWATALAAVWLGPWPVSMVNFPGLEHSPTNPPTIALLLFGSAYSATAIAAAPKMSAWLASSQRAWSAVVAANTIAMSVYLWHFTAMIIAVAIFLPLGLLPTAAINSAAWWLQKLPLMAVATVVLAAIVKLVAPIEQRALLAARTPWNGGQASLLVTAVVASTALKQWAHGSIGAVTISLIVLSLLWRFVLRGRSPQTEPISQ